MTSTEVPSERSVGTNGSEQQEVPAWLNEQFFEEIFVDKLKLKRGKFLVKVRSVVPTGGSGENYTSMLYHAKVDAECDDGTTRNLAVILKAMITAPELKAFGVFQKEKCFYEKVIPTMETIWANAGVEVQFGPRCWKSTEGDVDILVLDDLCANGYKVADRRKGLNLKHVHVLLAKLAKYHAATAVDYEENGPINAEFDKGLVQSVAKPMFDQYFKLITPVLLPSLDDWMERNKYQSILAKNMTGMFEKLRDATTKNDSKFIVLCHGDVWTNNHMYKYHPDSDDPEDALLIDFQNPYYSSPVMDLFYFLISSTTLELKTTQFDEMVQFYQAELSEALQKLNYPGKIPTLRDVHIELLKRAYFGMQCLYGILPVVLAEKSENANFAGFFGEDEANQKFRYDLYNNPGYQKQLRTLLKMFDRRGFLDFD